MESREKVWSVSNSGENPKRKQTPKPRGTGEDRSKFLVKVTKEGLGILKENERRYIPDTADELSSLTRKELNGLIQRSLTKWKKL